MEFAVDRISEVGPFRSFCAGNIGRLVRLEVSVSAFLFQVHPSSSFADWSLVDSLWHVLLLCDPRLMRFVGRKAFARECRCCRLSAPWHLELRERIMRYLVI